MLWRRRRKRSEAPTLDEELMMSGRHGRSQAPVGPVTRTDRASIAGRVRSSRYDRASIAGRASSPRCDRARIRVRGTAARIDRDSLEPSIRWVISERRSLTVSGILWHATRPSSRPAGSARNPARGSIGFSKMSGGRIDDTVVVWCSSADQALRRIEACGSTRAAEGLMFGFLKLGSQGTPDSHPGLAALNWQRRQGRFG